MKKAVYKYYQSLYRFAELVNSAHSPQEVLAIIAESVANAMGARGCAVMLLLLEKRILHTVAAYGLSEQYIRKGTVLAEKSIAEVLEGKPVAISDISGDERLQYPEEAKQEGVRSILAVPMMLKEEIIGQIRVYSATPRYFTRSDISFVRAAANLGAIALQNAKDMHLFGFP